MAITAIYCDGGCVKKNPSQIGGTWAYVCVESAFELGEPDTRGGLDARGTFVRGGSGFLPNSTYNTLMTNNIMEYEAVVKGLESMDAGWSGVVYSDSLITLERIFGNWRNKNVPESLIERKNKALNRLGKVTCRHVDGHPTKAQLDAGIGKRGNPVSRWNVMADSLCNEESKQAQIDLQFGGLIGYN